MENKNLEELNETIGCYADELLQIVKNKNLTVTQKYTQMKDVSKMLNQEKIWMYEDDLDYEYNTTTDTFNKLTEC
tara:strand:- start:457 stop:681 length:225 start_codon:yes stop_codon:yes gene_type:complete